MFRIQNLFDYYFSDDTIEWQLFVLICHNFVWDQLKMRNSFFLVSENHSITTYIYSNFGWIFRYNNFSYSEFISLAGFSYALVGCVIGSQPWVIIMSLVPFLCTSLGFFEYASDLLRVFTLAYFFRVRPNVISYRKDDIDHLRKFVQSNVSPGKFLLVHGPKGIGKSCAIETALSIFSAVFITSPIPSGLCSTNIMQIVLSELTQTDNHFNKRALNICKLYKWFFKASPVIVLCVRERLKGILLH